MAPDCSNIFSQLLDDHRRFVCLTTNLCPNVSKGPIIREIKDEKYDRWISQLQTASLGEIDIWTMLGASTKYVKCLHFLLVEMYQTP